jgi:hypothetical protein
MSTPDDWAKAFARQANVDFTAWELYQRHPSAVAAECHKLLFLQMACEKLCKAHVLRAGIHRQEIAISGKFPKNVTWATSMIKQLCGEIEILNPAMKRGNLRPDNCEYPWEAGGKVLSPLGHKFFPTQLLIAPLGRTFLTLLRRAIDRNL